MNYQLWLIKLNKCNFSYYHFKYLKVKLSTHCETHNWSRNVQVKKMKPIFNNVYLSVIVTYFFLTINTNFYILPLNPQITLEILSSCTINVNSKKYGEQISCSPYLKAIWNQVIESNCITVVSVLLIGFSDLIFFHLLVWHLCIYT